MFSLILAGEAIFCLPFHIGRFFRGTFLEVFEFDNQQAGWLISAYGVVAMLSYVFGGGLADRFPTRKLLAFALLSTGLAGFYLVQIPSFGEMTILYLFWGVTTILPFWAALIRATRDWGGHAEQGKAFGLLEGGRGLLAAGLAAVAVYLFQISLPKNPEDATYAELLAALSTVIYLYIFTCITAAVFVWLFVPEVKATKATTGTHRDQFGRLVRVMKIPSVWLQALIVICAYCTFKGIDYYSLYARDAYGMNVVDAAKIVAWSSWLRPVAALGAGFLADRLNTSRVIIACFGLLVVVYIGFATSPPSLFTVWVLWSNVLITSTAIFALRGIYFALLEEASIPSDVTGTAVGVVSFLGFTPEIFMPPLAGWLIDRWPGEATGHQQLFWLLAGISAVGVLVSWVMQKIHREGDGEQHPISVFKISADKHSLPLTNDSGKN